MKNLTESEKTIISGEVSPTDAAAALPRGEGSSGDFAETKQMDNAENRRRELAEAIVAEYELIQQKRSKLSRAQRERVVAVYEEARKTMGASA